MKFVEYFVPCIYEKGKISDVNLVFDRYHPNSIKRLTKMNRDTGASRV